MVFRRLERDPSRSARRYAATDIAVGVERLDTRGAVWRARDLADRAARLQEGDHFASASSAAANGIQPAAAPRDPLTDLGWELAHHNRSCQRGYTQMARGFDTQERHRNALRELLGGGEATHIARVLESVDQIVSAQWRMTYIADHTGTAWRATQKIVRERLCPTAKALGRLLRWARPMDASSTDFQRIQRLWHHALQYPRTMFGLLGVFQGLELRLVSPPQVAALLTAADDFYSRNGGRVDGVDAYSEYYMLPRLPAVSARHHVLTRTAAEQLAQAGLVVSSDAESTRAGERHVSLVLDGHDLAIVKSFGDADRSKWRASVSEGVQKVRSAKNRLGARGPNRLRYGYFIAYANARLPADDLLDFLCEAIPWGQEFDRVLVAASKFSRLRLDAVSKLQDLVLYGDHTYDLRPFEP